MIANLHIQPIQNNVSIPRESSLCPHDGSTSNIQSESEYFIDSLSEIVELQLLTVKFKVKKKNSKKRASQ